MSFAIRTAAERRSQARGVKLVLLGPSGIGKTTQLKTLPAGSTLFLDIEAGDLAVTDWQGDSLSPKTWPEFRNLVVYLAGPNPALPNDQVYSRAHYQKVCRDQGGEGLLGGYDTYFVDSITALSRLCMTWCKTQPGAFSERSGRPDTRGAYGLLGQEMIGALSHLQQARGKNVIFVGILDEKVDELGQRFFQAQIEGSKTGLELPGIVDEVITYTELQADDHSRYRAFVTHTCNPWGYPAKDRSGRLDLIEPPDLGALLAKCAQFHTPMPTQE